MSLEHSEGGGCAMSDGDDHRSESDRESSNSNSDSNSDEVEVITNPAEDDTVTSAGISNTIATMEFDRPVSSDDTQPENLPMLK